MIPAQQRLKPANIVGVEINQWLVVHLELAGFECVTKIDFEHAALQSAKVHFRFEKANAAPLVGLCPVKRQVGVAQQGFWIVIVLGRYGYADGRPSDYSMAFDVVGKAQGTYDVMSQLCALLTSSFQGKVLDHGEFVPAEPGHGVAGRGRPLQPSTDLPQQEVSKVMTEHVIDLLEAIQVNEVQRYLVGFGPALRKRLSQPAKAQCPIGQPRQAIEMCHTNELLFGAVALDCNPRNPRCCLSQADLVVAWASHVCGIEREGPQHRSLV